MNVKLNLLGLFRELLSCEGVCALADAVSAENADEAAEKSAEFYRFLTLSGASSAAEYVYGELLDTETVFSEAAAHSDADALLSRADTELGILKELAETDCRTIAKKLPESARAFFPEWKSGKFSVTAAELAENYRVCGYGAVRHKAVIYDAKTNELIPIVGASSVKLSDIKEYEDEKREAIANTLAFIENKPAANVLFYGDRGTGKSSTVHALVNEFSDRGLRLVQISKEAIPRFPELKRKLAAFPSLKFIIFLDDLTFEEDDPTYAAFKAALEGSFAVAENALIYVTTNRRHLVKESVSSREGDDVHAADTAQEQLSLFDRFGLVITYIAPDKREYISILRQILADRGIQKDDNELTQIAERYAIKKGGRSPRAAKQLADMIECNNKSF